MKSLAVCFCRVLVFTLLSPYRPFSRWRHLTTTTRIHFIFGFLFLNLSIPQRFNKQIALICTWNNKRKHSGSCSKMAPWCNNYCPIFALSLYSQSNKLRQEGLRGEYNMVSECWQGWQKIPQTHLHLFDQQKNENNRAHLFNASDLSSADF